ncbi:MAG: flavodoxin-dependent (E)-4-hydroxy-3-methylbut-2-enyl-diphosphate synthase [Spirochaetota bacterium]
MSYNRRKAIPVYAGNLLIGGDAPVSVQSMTNIPISQVHNTITQIIRLQQEGAQLVRLALRTEDDARFIQQIKKDVTVPLCADIHFNYKIALKAIAYGIDKLRINPGNIDKKEHVIALISAARERNIPIRIGVNSGSVNLKKYKEVTSQTLVASAMEHVQILEDCGYTHIVVSIKSSDLLQTIEANRIFASMRQYPIHIGLTEAGYGTDCIIASSMVIGTLLYEGIGDTIRISMTGDPVNEVKVAKRILEIGGFRFSPFTIIACPTCGRTDINLDILQLTQEIESMVKSGFEQTLIEKQKHITLAVMGCEVNGPGEASHADVGIAGARDGKVVLFAQGQKIKILPVKEAVNAVREQIEKMIP